MGLKHFRQYRANVEGMGGEMTNQPWDGEGQYNAFPEVSGGGGGGGGYTPPVEPNLAFVPPSYAATNNGPLKIYLSSNESAQFQMNDTNIGIGLSATDSYSPSLTFGNSRTYKAIVDSKISTNYYIVSIQKKYKTDYTFTNSAGQTSYNNYNTNPYNYNFNYTPQLTYNDVLYVENINISEFTLSEDGTYTEVQRTIDSSYGTVSLTFNFKSKPVENNNPIDVVITPTNPTMINYGISFGSNFTNELSSALKLKYRIVNGLDTIENSEVTLENGNTDAKSINADLLKNGEVYFDITGDLPEGFSYKDLYWAPNDIAAKYGSTDLSRWNKFDGTSLKLNASTLKLGGVSIISRFNKDLQRVKPVFYLTQTKYDCSVKDSDGEKEVNITFGVFGADFIDVYISPTKTIRVPATQGFANLLFKRDFGGVYGVKKVYLVPVSNLYGTGDRVEALINFISINDFPSITQIVVPDIIDIPSFSDLQIEYDVTYNSFATTHVDIAVKAKNGVLFGLFNTQPSNGTVKINIKTLAEKFSQWNGSDNITLVFTPYNNGGSTNLTGNPYEVITKLNYPTIRLNEDDIKKSIYDAFVSKLSFIEPVKESKYLTHLANFGNNEQILISSYEEDNWTLSDKTTDELGNLKVTNEIKSVILKLYSPLPADIVTNSTFWITKLMSNPLIETVILNDQSQLECPPIKGPNFGIEVDFVTGQSTSYESLDNLIFSTEATSSANLVATYLSSSIINTDELNIEYGADDTYYWNNFIHFSSAEERVNNFVYKVQLIEKYEDLIISSSIGAGSIAEANERERQTTKKNQLIQGFDGFEKFLYTSSSLSWPHNGSIRLRSTDTIVKDSWYVNIVALAENFDVENPNWVINNIPQYIVNNDENDSLLLFFSMVGQHFDNIYFHTKAIEKSRGLGYKAKDGISDKLLFDALKSFGWDAKNLSANSKLWEYTFGLDLDGNTKFESPAKQRTYEVWRRIINNLPYLLKHKGTRRGIYALMSCYGIPSSNLSILEFGGPEVSELSKSKLIFDNITSALTMISGSSIEFDWKNTERNRKPDTIEFFVKPSTNGNYQIISGSGWNISISGSNVADYGKIIFNYSGSNSITSSILPIFNEQFFGIEVSREVSGSYHNFELNIRQSDKERSIFQETKSASVLIANSNWNNGSNIKLGNNFVGSLDEFRLWSTPLEKERFFEHVSFPEMINGNHISASTDDLYFRLDFEYPKNLAETSSLINVDTNMYFSASLNRNHYEEGSNSIIYSLNPSASFTASAYGFNSITTYPYQFEPIDRSVVLEIPDVGSTRYSTNKVRFETQTLPNGMDVSTGVNLSIKSRATKKAFDQSPTDSNRVGLFFSPTKELNIDIAKSFGGINLDNYIGDPADRYKSNYKRLDDLRKYYFQRFDGRDIYAYINLIKLYEKSMFEDIKKMLPARVKATTGLLIEPHILERSKIEQKKPTANDYQKDVVIHYDDTTIMSAENQQYNILINSDLSENLKGENNQYQTLITDTTFDQLNANSYQLSSTITSDENTSLTSNSYQQDTTIDAGLGEPTILTELDVYDINTIVGQSDYEKIGFGLYGKNGYAIRTYYDLDKTVIKERIKVDLIKERKTRDVVKYNIVINGQGDPRGGTFLTSSIYYETKLNIQPYSGSQTITPGTGDIVEVKPLNGYLPTHYKNTSDLTRGLQNSFYKGSKNTAATTLDGSSPIETFTTNPNTLKVNKAGRDVSEPILEVE